MRDFNDNKFNEKLEELARDIEIEVPESLRKNVLNTLDKLPEKSSRKKNNYKRVAGYTAFILAGLLAFNTVMPVYAEKLPILGPTFESINEALGIGERYIEGAKETDLVQAYDNITMTIKNIYYDGIELAIAYEIKSEEALKEKPVIFPLIKKRFKYLDYTNETHEGEFIDDNTYVGIASYVFEDEVLPDKVNITFTVNDIYGKWVGYYPEKFKFRLKLDAENMGKRTHEINKEFSYEGSNFKITNVVTSPFNTIIYWQGDVETIKYYDNELEHTGNKHDLTFKAIDNNGMPLEFRRGQGNGGEVRNDRMIGEGNWRFSEIPKDIKSITFIPYIHDYLDTNVSKVKLNKGSETSVKSENQEYIIKSIDFQEDKTLIDIKIKKYLNGINYLGINLYDEEENIIEYTEEDIEFNGIEEGYNYILTLPKLDREEDYYIKIHDNSKILEDEKITVDLTEKNNI